MLGFPCKNNRYFMLKSYLTKVWTDSAILNNQILKSLVTPAKKAKILDIGVYRAELILDRVKNIKKPEIFAIDMDSQAIASCKKKDIKAKKYNIEKGLPYSSNSFDIVSANQIIEHVVNIDLFFSEINRVLKPKGYLILSTENLSSWHNLFALLLGWQAFSQHISTKSNIGNPLKLNLKVGGKNHDCHIQIFTPRGLNDLAQMYNLNVENKFGAGYYPFLGNFSKILSKIDKTHSAFIGIKARKI
jgi:SAM-dependent methyltransferase